MDDKHLIFCGEWSQKGWMNTPGPFYHADTDNCGTGPLAAPNNVCTDERGYKIVFRQPVNHFEFRQVLMAAEREACAGYAINENSYWSYETVKEWWQQRGKMESVLREWRGSQIEFCYAKDFGFAYRFERWLNYINSKMQDYLSTYSFFLLEARAPTPTDTLPRL